MEGLVGGSVASFTEIDEVISTLKAESRFFMGIERSEIQILTDALEKLNHFLEGADAKSVEEVMSKSMKNWLEETEKAEEVNGYVEEDCLFKLSQLLQERQIVNFLGQAGNRFATKLNSSRNQASDAETIEALPLDLEKNDQTREEEGERHSQKPFYTFVEEFVDSAAKDVMAWLTKGAPIRSVYSLVELGGIDETGLAREVYDSETVRGHFDCCAWINVSRSYQMKELLMIMIKKITRAGEHDAGYLVSMRTVELISTLRQSLESKRYMFVFDDVCHEEFWHVMKQALPDNENGSRIIITTTSDTVFDSCKEGSFDQLEKLGPLSDAMSMELFCRIVFQDEPEQRCPTGLEQLATEILGMCRGFPFLILLTARLLVSEWQILCTNRALKLNSNLHSSSILDVLAREFDVLPYHLRPCFLYFSFFPKDSLIPKEKLFKLWIAESFIAVKIGKTLEEVAQEYLNELIDRDLVQLCQGFYGLEQFCRVHRLIHNIAHSKANEIMFCNTLDNNHSNIKRKLTIRLSIENDVSAVMGSIYPKVQSLFLFNIGTLPGAFMATLTRECKLLMLLDLENVPIEHLPEDLGNLFYLTYLSLKNTKVRTLPKSMHKLQNLQTLDLRNTLLIELPIEINSLENLRHLLASVHDNRISGDSSRGVTIKKGIGSLENLHTLMTVDAHINLIKDLRKLQNLRRLGISGLTAKVATALCSYIKETCLLESLSLQSMNFRETLSLHSKTSPPALLKRLVLKGLLQDVPAWISRLQNLSMICLSLSRLTNDPLIHLSLLPNLESLWLYRAYEGEKLHFEEGGFKRLKLLALSELRGLKRMEIEPDALPLLEELRIGSSPFMNEVPYGIEQLRNLKVLANYDMPSEFVLSLQPDGGSEYWKVEHIPSVLFWYRVHQRKYMLFKLGDSDLLKHLQGFITTTDVVEQHEHDLQSSFCYFDDEDDKVDWFGSRPVINLQKNTKQWSFSSGFYTDDIEE